MHVHVDGDVPGAVLGENLSGCHYIEMFDFLLRFSKTVKTTSITKLNDMMNLHPDCADQIRVVMGEILRKKDV